MTSANAPVRLAALVVAMLAAIAPLTVQAGADVPPQQQPATPNGWPCEGHPDPSYLRVAEASGGFLFLFHPSEVAESGAILGESGRDRETVLRAVGTLDDGLRSYSWPVDATIERVMIAVSLQCLQVVEVTDAAGALLQASDPNVQYHQFEAGRVIVATHPAAGRWTARVSGRGLFALVVQAKSAVSLRAVEFGPIGTPGEDPAMRPLPAGTGRQRVRIHVSGGVRGVELRAVSALFESATRIPLRPLPESGAYEGAFTPPPAPYRLVLRGTDPQGQPFQRVHAPLLSPR